MSSTLIRGQAALLAPGVARRVVYSVHDFGAVGDGATDDGPAFNAAYSAITAAGGGVLRAPAPSYAIKTAITPQSKVRVRGNARGGTTLQLQGTAQTIVLGSASGLTGVAFEDITFDANSLGSCLLLAGQAGSDIAIRRCVFKNAVQNTALPGTLGWAVAIGTPSGAATVNVTFSDNIVGPNAAVHYEAAIFLNCQNLTIRGNAFTGNTTASFGTGLAVYAYCRNVTISENTFDTNSIDCYIQQSDTLTFAGNTFLRSASGVSLDIYSCRTITIGLNTFKTTAAGCVGIRIFDQYDQGLATFNGNSSLYAFTKDVSIGPCTFAGYYVPMQCYSPVMTSTQVAVNLMQDIDIHDCLWDNDIGTAALYGVQIGCAYTQNMQRITVRNCHHAGGNYNGGGGVLVQGNAGFTATTTTQAITASAAKQTVTMASTTGIVAGMWLHVDDGSHGTAEEVYVYAVPVAGQITAIFAQTHTSGAAVANSTTLANSGLTDIPITNYKVQPSSTGNSSGVILWNTPQSCNVDITNCDLTNAGTGTGGKVVLIGTGAYRTARGNQGFNPVIAPTGFGTALPTTPTTATFYQNTSGVDAYVQVKQAGVTGTHLYVNSTNSTTGALDYGAATAWPGVLFVPAGSYLRADFSAGTVTLLWQGT